MLRALGQPAAPRLWQTENSCGGLHVKPIQCLRFCRLAGRLRRRQGKLRRRDIYPDPAQAKAELAAALKTAAQTHKRILLDFGGNWCGDCQVLDLYLHDPRNLPILEANFVLVHINIGHMDATMTIAASTRSRCDKGVPAMAVLAEKASCSTARRAASLKPCAAWSPQPSPSSWCNGSPQAGCSAVVVNC